MLLSRWGKASFLHVTTSSMCAVYFNCGSLETSFLGKLGTRNQDYPCCAVCVGPVVCCCKHVQCKASLLISLHAFPGKHGGL